MASPLQHSVTSHMPTNGLKHGVAAQVPLHHGGAARCKQQSSQDPREFLQGVQAIGMKYSLGNECIEKLGTRPLTSAVMHNWSIEQRCAKP